MARILVVEDDSSLATLLACWLEEDGHEPKVLNNGDEGINELIKSHAAELLITDVVMPQASGEELAIAYECFAPKVPVLVITGMADEATLARLRERPNVVKIMKKPFSAEALRAAVSAALLVWRD